MKIRFIALGILLLAGTLQAAQTRFAFVVDEEKGSYTITENGEPVLTYLFGEVGVPAGMEAPHFSKGNTDYDGAYFTDGSEYGAARSDYIHPIYGFSGETLTVDFPADHMHHRGLSWSWCEVKRGEKIGDLWAVCKIRAYPVEITKQEANDERAILTAVNVWRFDDETENIVKETATITVHRTTQDGGVAERAIDVDVTLEALVDGVSISGRQKVDYGGYGGMTIRLNEERSHYALRAVHPNPDSWRGDDADFAERVIDPDKLGDAAWMALSADFTAADGTQKPTTLLMMEKKSTPLYPNNFRYYGTTCTSLAFPAKTHVPLEVGKPLVYQTRTVVCEGKTTLDTEKRAFDAYQNETAK